MDLWIRSQSKKDIMKVERVGVSLSGLSIIVNGIVYGEFETEERVIEVLNNIYYKLMHNSNSIVYQIPEK